MPGPPLLTAAPPAAERLDLLRADARRGEVAVALAGLLDLGLEWGRLEPSALDVVVRLGLLVECHLARGDVDAAVALTSSVRARLADEPRVAAHAHRSLGELAAATGDDDTAVEHLLAAGPGLDAAGDQLLVPWRSDAAHALLRAGRRPEALELARHHHALALAGGTGYDLAVALRTLATADSDRISRLREAREVLAGGDGVRLAAQVATDLAGLLILQGESVESLALLREAEAFAGSHDLWPLQNRVRRLLERLGQAPRRQEAEALSVLTAAEQRVARLTVQGLSNREVAERLGVSVKAVEGHLSKIYRRLGLRSRAGLAATITA